MQRHDGQSSARPKTKKRHTRIKRRASVCLISNNPLALAELHRRVSRGSGAFRLEHVNSGIAQDVHGLRVPAAAVYVLDAFSTGPITEAVVAGIRSRRPNARVIVLARKSPSPSSFALLRLGVKGLIRYPDDTRQLSRAIRSVARGGVWVPREMMADFLESILGQPRHGARARTFQRLSRREEQVRSCMLKNMSNKEIANTLHISESTVKFHVAGLFHKLGVRRRTDLILQSLQEPSSQIH